MAAQFRYEFHWVDGRVVKRRVRRPDGKKQWQHSLHEDTLIAVIEPSEKGFSFRPGPAFSQHRAIEALLEYKGLLEGLTASDIGTAVPDTVAQHIANYIYHIVDRIKEQFDEFAEETDITGHLKGSLPSASFTQDGWKVKIRSWTYTRRPKERDYGIDLGVIADVQRGEERIVKAMWFQAKLAANKPDDILALPDLASQMADMQRHTNEAYALVYTPNDVVVYRGDDSQNALELPTVIAECVQCKRGDTEPIVVALTSDSRVMIEIFVTESPGDQET